MGTGQMSDGYNPRIIGGPDLLLIAARPGHEVERCGGEIKAGLLNILGQVEIVVGGITRINADHQINLDISSQAFFSKENGLMPAGAVTDKDDFASLGLGCFHFVEIPAPV